MARSPKSKTLAAWLAFLGGPLGLHRFYLHGLKDRWGWAFPLPTLLGLGGLQRMEHLGQDDRVAWVLIPLLGISLVAAMAVGVMLVDIRSQYRATASFESILLCWTDWAPRPTRLIGSAG